MEVNWLVLQLLWSKLLICLCIFCVCMYNNIKYNNNNNNSSEIHEIIIYTDRGIAARRLDLVLVDKMARCTKIIDIACG